MNSSENNAVSVHVGLVRGDTLTARHQVDNLGNVGHIYQIVVVHVARLVALHSHLRRGRPPDYQCVLFDGAKSDEVMK